MVGVNSPDGCDTMALAKRSTNSSSLWLPSSFLARGCAKTTSPLSSRANGCWIRNRERTLASNGHNVRLQKKKKIPLPAKKHNIVQWTNARAPFNPCPSLNKLIWAASDDSGISSTLVPCNKKPSKSNNGNDSWPIVTLPLVKVNVNVVEAVNERTLALKASHSSHCPAKIVSADCLRWWQQTCKSIAALIGIMRQRRHRRPIALHSATAAQSHRCARRTGRLQLRRRTSVQFRAGRRRLCNKRAAAFATNSAWQSQIGIGRRRRTSTLLIFLTKEIEQKTQTEVGLSRDNCRGGHNGTPLCSSASSKSSANVERLGMATVLLALTTIYRRRMKSLFTCNAFFFFTSWIFNSNFCSRLGNNVELIGGWPWWWASRARIDAVRG